MPKLIRLLGDAESNSTEIRNTFRQPIIIKPNSKVALVGASVLLTDDIVNEQFIINEANKYFQLGAVTAPLTSSLTTGAYYAHGLADEFAVAGNYAGTGATDDNLGLHHTSEIIENRFVLKTHKANLESPGFNDVTRWDTLFGSGTLTANSVIGGTNGIVMSTDLNQSMIPMVHNRFKFTVATAGKIQVGTEGWGVDVSGGVYFKQLALSRTSTGVSWQAGDVVQMDTYAGGYHLKIDSSGGVNKLTVDNLLAIPRSYYGKQQNNNKWLIDIATSASITNCTCTTLYNVPENNRLQDTEVTAELRFKDSNNQTNMILAIFMGFGLSGGSPIIYSGNPATLGGRAEMTGIANYPGILVTIDGLAPLQSFDGASQSKSQDNILYVLNDLSVINGNNLQLDIPAPFFLDLNNANPVNINELRARFLPASGQFANPALSFSGKPSLTLLIDG